MLAFSVIPTKCVQVVSQLKMSKLARVSNWWWVIVLVMLTGSGAVGLLVYSVGTYQTVYVGEAVESGSESEKAQAEVASVTEAEAEDDHILSVALLGHGSPGHQGGLLTDTMMVIRVDQLAEQVAVISIPRDAWVALPSSGYPETFWKINAAYAIGNDSHRYLARPEQFQGAAGGGNLAKYALAQVVGFPIDYFVAVDFDGFVQAIDVLGGIDLRVDRTFEDPLYPITGKESDPCQFSPEDIAAMTATMSATLLEPQFACRYEVLHFDQGLVHLDGETALKFARSRHAEQDGGDFGRATRQRKVLVAVRDKVIAIGFLPKAIPFINSIAGHVRTDIPLETMKELLSLAPEVSKYQVVGVALSTAEDNVLTITHSGDRQSILLPKEQTHLMDWSSVHEFIQTQLAQ